MTSFHSDLEFAELGEDKLWLYLLKAEGTRNVLDVRKDPWFQKIDIDFIRETNKGMFHKYEVKTDRQAHETGNFVFETKSNSNVGCLARSRADYVYYYLSETGAAYLVIMPELRKYISNNNFKEYVMGDNARGYLIPIADLVRNNIAVEVKS